MIEIICGEKGTGKTKRIISLANGISDQAKGSMVFIDDDNSYMYDLGYSIRFINVTDYALSDPDMFLGFLCGLCAPGRRSAAPPVWKFTRSFPIQACKDPPAA